MFGLFWFDWTLLIVLPAMLFAFWAQYKVQSTFSKYSTVVSRSGCTGYTAARRLLDSKGLYSVDIRMIEQKLADHYDPRKKTLFLSRAVYTSTSASAVGVACHEAGHAIQDAKDYSPMRLRMAIVPVCNIGSNLAMPLFLIGLLLSYGAQTGTMAGDVFMLAGIASFSLVTLFQLVTLPVEFNASRRALEGMRDCDLLDRQEIGAARKVLSAAAMTYVAALATSLASLLRLIVIFMGNRRSDR